MRNSGGLLLKFLKLNVAWQPDAMSYFDSFGERLRNTGKFSYPFLVSPARFFSLQQSWINCNCSELKIIINYAFLCNGNYNWDFMFSYNGKLLILAELQLHSALNNFTELEQAHKQFECYTFHTTCCSFAELAA